MCTQLGRESCYQFFHKICPGVSVFIAESVEDTRVLYELCLGDFCSHCARCLLQRERRSKILKINLP